MSIVFFMVKLFNVIVVQVTGKHTDNEGLDTTQYVFDKQGGKTVRLSYLFSRGLP